MKVIDVFNGDADGIFSLIQLRQANPVSGEHQLITGVKRDINLLSKIDSSQADKLSINALDISFDKNVADVKRLLDQGANIFYCDHHKADQLFNHYNLEAVIDTSAFVCTGLLINQHLQTTQNLWSIAALFGDGLDKVAYELSSKLAVSDKEIEKIKSLGVLVNYNGYGATINDLHYNPADLYRSLVAYDSPLEVVRDPGSSYHRLSDCFEADLTNAQQTLPLIESELVYAVKLPNEAWSKRISGTYGNRLSKEKPSKAIIIATDNVDKTLTISLRAPKTMPHGASKLCSAFPSGGGRESAAGINALEASQLDNFIAQVADFYKD